MNSLRVVRKENGYTLQNLSILSGITVPHLSFLENGKAVPTEITRVRLEGILEQRIDFLIVPDLNIEPLNPPADWNQTERQFRFLIGMIKSLPKEEQFQFCSSVEKPMALTAISRSKLTILGWG